MSIWITLSIHYIKTVNSNERLVLSMGLSFIALVLLANFTKGQSNNLNDKFIFPMYSDGSEDCDMVIEFNMMSFSRTALYATMTTNYNESYDNILDKTPFVMPLKQYLGFNASKVFTWNVNDTVSAKIRCEYGDVLHLLDSNSLGRNYIVYSDKDYFVTVYGTEANTSVTISSINNTVIEAHRLDVGNTITFDPNSSDVYQINASGRIGIIYSNVDITRNIVCDQNDDIVWEMIPPMEKNGKEFMMHIPNVESAFLEVLGYEDGLLKLHLPDGLKTINLKAFERKMINVSHARDVHMTSSTHVSVFSTLNLTTDTNRTATNILSVFPAEQFNNCLYVTIFNCTNNVCGYLVTENGIHSISLYNMEGKTVQTFNTSDVDQNKTTASFEISVISDGIYFLLSENSSVHIIFYYVNLSHGRYYQSTSLDKTNCDIFVFSQTPNFNEETSVSTNTLVEKTSVPNDNLSSTHSINNVSGAYIENVTVSYSTIIQSQNNTLINQSAQSVPKLGSLSYLTSNTSTQNETTAVQQINNRLIFPFMYEEIPDDDSVLNTYLIAVIVSLCTAIFAVIAVISTFLLLEILRRRRQIRNTKIRPFVS
ncbi:uncharacterized protein LOC127705674 [Mytilus californianus]|uniref:uncharacterized protein LOC127705674 n=1 Tax=Mytilus californianus TaxID=6549 RepID=UPI002246E862|nr:uncharacterized protein LOC127705674 [Mytilus californianus]XP_052065976.1 uncharacterized protein LOC127705674 [Mytilus californianus]